MYANDWNIHISILLIILKTCHEIRHCIFIDVLFQYFGDMFTVSSSFFLNLGKHHLMCPFHYLQLDKEDEDSDFEDEDDRDFYQLAHMPI